MISLMVRYKVHTILQANSLFVCNLDWSQMLFKTEIEIEQDFIMWTKVKTLNILDKR